MAVGTLVVGIGGTGVLTVRALKQIYCKKMNPAERVPATFQAIDFDRSAELAEDERGRLAKLETEEFLYLNPNSIQETLRNLDRAQDGEFAWKSIRKWFPNREKTPIPTSEIEANGASQLRALGRIGFFQNDEVIETTLRRRLAETGATVDQTRLDRAQRVILVASLAGGTGAGMLLDFAYIVRRMSGRPRVYLYLLLPEVFQDVDAGGRIYPNSYAILKELAYLKDQQIPFHSEYPHIAPLDILPGREEPFARIFLFQGRRSGTGAAIRESCILIADAISAQLHAVVQEKTLAVVSNTLSTDEKEDQRRKRTHCFGTSGNTLIEFKPNELNAEHVLHACIDALIHPDQMKIEDQRLDSMYQALEERIDSRHPMLKDHELTPEPPPKIDDSKWPAGSSPIIQRIRQQFKSIAAAGAQLLRDELARDLSGLKSRIEAKESIESLKPQIELHEKVIQAGVGSDLYNPDIEKLSSKSALDEIDACLTKSLAEWLPETAAESEPAALIRRWRFFSELQRFDDFLVDERKSIAPSGQESTQDQASVPQKPRISLWKKIASMLDVSSAKELTGVKDHDQAKALTGRLALLAQSDALLGNLRYLILKRAKEAWHERVESLGQKSVKHFERAKKTARTIRLDDQLYGEVQRLRESKSGRFKTFVGKILPLVADELAKNEKLDPEKMEEQLLEMIGNAVSVDPEIQQERVAPPDGFHALVREKLVEARQNVFERRTPNPQRKGFCIILVPKGISRNGGLPEDQVDPLCSARKENLERFLLATCSQILDCRPVIETYRGDDVWIYFEDLFNPPDHIFNIDEYYRRYQSGSNQELYHIDRRFLDESIFRDIHSAASGKIATCGNKDCQENIAHLDPANSVCPGCGKMIVSRCGNKGCTEVALHLHSDYRKEICPACGGFNNAAWWRCNRHGKMENLVPIDKVSCPLCIEDHHRDRIKKPASEIGRRPDQENTVLCPNCEKKREKEPNHPCFAIPSKLRKFYNDGVNGHDRADFEELARKHKLGDNVRCPNCRTLLIPVHHDKDVATA